MNSRCLFAERITGTTIATATSRPGGANRLLIQSRRHGSSGLQRVVSNEGDGNLLPLFIGRTVPSEKEVFGEKEAAAIHSDRRPEPVRLPGDMGAVFGRSARDA